MAIACVLYQITHHIALLPNKLSMEAEPTPDAPLTCSQSKCKRLVPSGPYKTCDPCRTKNTEARKVKRARDKEAEEARKRARTDDPAENRGGASRNEEDGPDGPESSDTEGDSPNTFTQFKDGQSLFLSLREAFKHNKHVDFRGTYQTPEDPLITDKERVQMTVYEIWTVTGYRFRVKENNPGEAGHRTRLWCCQDKARKQKARPSDREGAKPRDTLGMHRFDCNSHLRVSSLAGEVPGERKISISLRHHDSHVHYYDVSMPPEAAAIIRDGLEWSTPVEMVGRTQRLFPHVTASQVHSAWSQMSEILWKRDKMQLPSAEILLKELGDDVDVLDVHSAEGVEQIAWVMKKIMEPLHGKIVEIGIDATCGCSLPAH
ncbi:hypothetical protein C8R44DRAFT_654310 [Mycena epipterygia]|nr:hypothetical protein C8R44DRAFT_654310 [Mycena epipterygia]